MINESIISLYNSNITCTNISTILNIPVHKIRYILKKENLIKVSAKKNYRKYTLDENYFNDIDTEMKSYLLGFLMADGSIDEERNTLRLMCADQDILKLLQTELKTNKPIRFVQNSIKNIKHKDMYDISICSLKICSDLIKHGIIKRKSYYSEFPKNLNSNLIHHFIRGYFDGDGCITHSITFTGNKNFLTSLKDILFLETGYNPHVYVRFPERNNDIITIAYCKKDEVLTIKNYLYKNATVYLNRKYEKFPESRKDSK